MTIFDIYEDGVNSNLRCPECGGPVSVDGTYVSCDDDDCGYWYDLDGDDFVDASDYDD